MKPHNNNIVQFPLGRPDEIDIADRVSAAKDFIQFACQTVGLNLCVYDGKIGFVDQEHKKIVALWEPQFSMQDLRG